MVIKNCPKCGGEHWGSYKCPFTDEEIAAMSKPEPLSAPAALRLKNARLESEIQSLKSEARREGTEPPQLRQTGRERTISWPAVLSAIQRHVARGAMEPLLAELRSWPNASAPPFCHCHPAAGGGREAAPPLDTEAQVWKDWYHALVNAIGAQHCAGHFHVLKHAERLRSALSAVSRPQPESCANCGHLLAMHLQHATCVGPINVANGISQCGCQRFVPLPSSGGVSGPGGDHKTHGSREGGRHE